MRIRGQCGFTFIELLTVLGIVAITCGFALFVSIDTFHGTNFRSDRSVLAAILQRARAQAMNNICVGICTDGKPHGVHIDSRHYVLFQGDTYDYNDPQNAVFEASPGTSHAGMSDIVFSQLSATTSTVGNITLTDQEGHSSTITIGSEGQIAWTN